MRFARPKDLALRASIPKVARLINNKATVDLLRIVKRHCAKGNDLCEEPYTITGKDGALAYIADSEVLIEASSHAEAELLLISVAFLSIHSDIGVARLSEYYESRHQYSETISFINELIRCKKLTPEAAYQMAFALYKIGRTDASLECILPYYISEPTHRVTRLCGLLLKSIGRAYEAIDVLATAIETDPADRHSLRALSEIYAELGMYQKSLDIIRMTPKTDKDSESRIYEAIIHRLMGNNEYSIELLSGLVKSLPHPEEALWPQCFNYSIAGSPHAHDLPTSAKAYWNNSGYLNPNTTSPCTNFDDPLRIGFLTADIGEHVVSRFLVPLLRSYNKGKFWIALLSTARRFEQKSKDIASMADKAISLQGLSLSDARACIQGLNLDIILDTNGFTRNSGLRILGQRCAPIQAHYIGYHATTGLATIDYFLGDSITTPPRLQYQYTEKLVQIPNLWIAYDESIDFPEATSKSTRDSPVFGAYSQVAKINAITLEYWANAMLAAPDSILVIKDKGCQCDTTRKRIEDALEKMGVDQSRVYFFGPVASHLDHLDAYNAIDIALDTTPWSSATTAFEALGMGVPLVAICGDTTSSRMSTSVVSAAGKSHWIAHSKEDFGRIAAELAEDYQHLRESKSSMQREIRSGILFDKQRICHDFYATIERLASNRVPSKKEEPKTPKSEANSVSQSE